MSAVMRGARLASEPVVLARSQSPSMTAGAGEQRVQPVPLEMRAAIGAGTRVVSEPEPALPGSPRMTHDEFERQLGAQLDVVRREAREQGLREGRDAGLAKIEREEAARLDALAALIRSARARLEEGIAGLTDIGAQIVFEAVGKIVGRAGVTPEGVIAIVREVVQHARDRTRLVIRVNRADHAWLEANRARLLEGLDSGQVELVIDDHVVLGGCILETSSGSLDGRLETQLASLRDALLAAKSRRPDAEAGA